MFSVFICNLCLLLYFCCIYICSLHLYFLLVFAWFIFSVWTCFFARTFIFSLYLYFPFLYFYFLFKLCFLFVFVFSVCNCICRRLTPDNQRWPFKPEMTLKHAVSLPQAVCVSYVLRTDVVMTPIHRFITQTKRWMYYKQAVSDF